LYWKPSGRRDITSLQKTGRISFGLDLKNWPNALMHEIIYHDDDLEVHMAFEHKTRNVKSARKTVKII
jgi:hypothetical protein